MGVSFYSEEEPTTKEDDGWICFVFAETKDHNYFEFFFENLKEINTKALHSTLEKLSTLIDSVAEAGKSDTAEAKQYLEQIRKIFQE